MALKPCPECKAQISATADTCPRCGNSFKKRNRDRAQVGCLFVLGFIALLGAMSIGLKDIEPNNEHSRPAQDSALSPGQDEHQSDNSLLIGHMATLSTSFSGCPNQDITNKLKSLLLDNDAAVRKCHHNALKDKSELSELELPKAKIECQQFVRDGGGTSMSIWINDHEARKRH